MAKSLRIASGIALVVATAGIFVAPGTLSAYAGTRVVTLDGHQCKGLGGTWTRAPKGGGLSLCELPPGDSANLSTSISIPAGTQLKIDGGASLTVPSAYAIDNSGSLHVYGALTNSGTTNTTGPANATTDFYVWGTLDNFGTISVSGGASANDDNYYGTANIINEASGSLSISSGSVFEISGTFTNYGNLYNEATAGEIYTQTGVFDNYNFFANSAYFNNGGESTFTNESGGVIDQVPSGTIENSGGTIINDLGGIIYNGKAPTLLGGAITNDFGQTIDDYGTITNYGSITSDGTINIESSGHLDNVVTLDNQTNGVINNDGTLVNYKSGIFTNEGTFITSSNGTFVNTGTFTNTGTYTP